MAQLYEGNELADLGLEPIVYESLERDLQNFLNTLAGTETLERFREQYEKLHRSLKKSHDNEKKLIKKCRDLNMNITKHAGQVQVALKLTQEDSQTIQKLKSELEKTYKVLEMSKEREDKNKQKIESLQAEVKHLNALLQNNDLMSSGQQSGIQELFALKDELTKERDFLNQNLVTLKNELSQIIEKVRQEEQDKVQFDNEYKGLKKQQIEVEEKVQKDEDRIKKIQDELDTVNKNYEIQRKDYDQLQEEKKLLQAEKETKKRLIQERLHEKENLLAENQQLKNRISKNQDIYEEQINDNKDLEQYRIELDHNITQLKKQLNSQRTLNNQIEKQNDKLRNEIKYLTEQRAEILKQKDITKNSLSHIEKEVQDTKKYAREDKKLLEDLRNTREYMQKDLQKIENTNKKQAEEINLRERTLKEKEKDIFNLNKELDSLEKKILLLEKEKEKYGIQAAQANEKYFHSLEEIKLKDNLISEFQKKNIETEQKLKQQQNLYEQVRSDRNLYSKMLTETQDEIAEIKRRYKIVNHQISQLKEEIDAKEVALAKEHFEHKKKDKTCEEQSRINEKMKKDLMQKEENIKNYEGELGKLNFIIKESEQKRQVLKKDYENIVAERDILGTQLIRRNDEAALLFEKIKIQQSTLAKGESAYRERLSDIDLLKNKINDSIREKQIIRRDAKKVPDFKSFIYNLERELVEEKLKVKALSEELENPMNQERYRKLHGSDPDSYEMGEKITTLQRRLIAKTEEVVEKEVILQQKEKNIQEMREIMKRQPGVEEAKMISQYQQLLKQKTRQMKATAAELNMYQAQLNEYKYEIERLTKEIQEINRKYNEQKRRHQLQKELKNGGGNMYMKQKDRESQPDEEEEFEEVNEDNQNQPQEQQPQSNQQSNIMQEQSNQLESEIQQEVPDQ